MNGIFVSYAKEDKGIAKKIVTQLETKGIACTIFPRDLKNTDNRKEETDKTIGESKAFIFLLSKFSENNHEFYQQLETAYDNDVYLIPVKVGSLSNNIGIKHLLHSVEWVDIHGDGFDDGFDILTEIIDEVFEGKTPVKKTVKKKNTSGKPVKINSNFIILGIVAIAAIIIVILVASPDNDDKKDNKNYVEAQNTLTYETDNLNESDKKLVGEWVVSDYFDNLPIPQSEKQATIDMVVGKAKIQFGSNKAFRRMGFSIDPRTGMSNVETGQWRFDETQKRITLVADNRTKKEGVMQLSEFTENKMTMVVVEPYTDPQTNAISNVTTKITFTKQ